MLKDNSFLDLEFINQNKYNSDNQKSIDSNLEFENNLDYDSMDEFFDNESNFELEYLNSPVDDQGCNDNSNTSIIQFKDGSGEVREITVITIPQEDNNNEFQGTFN